MISSESPHPLHGPFSEIQCHKFWSQTAPHSWVTVPWPWSTSGMRCIVSVDVNKTTQKKSSQDPPPQKEHINMWSKKSIRLKNKVSWQTNEETEIYRDMWQERNVLEKMCRLETSFLISLTLLSNNNDWPPRSNPGHTHAYTRTINTQWTKLPGVEAKERDTRTQPTARLGLKESERERARSLKNAHVISECRNKL